MQNDLATSVSDFRLGRYKKLSSAELRRCPKETKHPGPVASTSRKTTKNIDLHVAQAGDSIDDALSMLQMPVSNSQPNSQTVALYRTQNCKNALR